MGAMENKSLNIFNSRRVLSTPETTSDTDIQTIAGVVGHEYFHNWTGNRVTCRDWFQLTLKEGLTIFRDQEFSSDTFSRPVKRYIVILALYRLSRDQLRLSSFFVFINFLKKISSFENTMERDHFFAFIVSLKHRHF